MRKYVRIKIVQPCLAEAYLASLVRTPHIPHASAEEERQSFSWKSSNPSKVILNAHLHPASCFIHA